MLVVLFFGLIQYLVIFSIGTHITEWMFKEQNNQINFLEKYFLGLICSTAIASTCLVFIPGSNALFIFLLIGFYTTWRSKSQFVQQFNSFNNLNIKWKIIFSTILFFAVLSGLFYPMAPDSWLYHIQCIKWFESYPLVKGLGNLHERFAFNPSIFSLFSVFTFRKLIGHPVYLLNLISWVVMSIYIVEKIRIVAPVLKMSYMLLLGGITLYSGQFLSSPTHDLSGFFYMVPIVFILERKCCNYYDFILMVFFSMAALMCKLTFAPLILIVLIAFLELKPFKLYPLWQFCFFFLFLLSCLLTWLYGNYILSGYVVFPFYSVDFFAPNWKIPREIVKYYKEIVYDFGFRNGTVVTDAYYKLVYWQKFVYWVRTLSQFSKLYIIYWLFTLAFISIAMLLAKFKFKINGKILLLSAFGVIFILYFGPDIRYLYPYLILSIFTFNIDPSVKLQSVYVSLSLITCLFIALFNMAYPIYKGRILMSPYLILTTDFSFKNVSSSAKLTYFKNLPQVRVPENGLCFDEPLPCAVENRNIMLISNSIKDGFMPIHHDTNIETK